MSKSLKRKNLGPEFPQFVSLLDGHEKDIFAHSRRENLKIAWTELDRLFVVGVFQSLDSEMILTVFSLF